MVADDMLVMILVITFFIFFLLISILPVLEEIFGWSHENNDDEDIY